MRGVDREREWCRVSLRPESWAYKDIESGVLLLVGKRVSSWTWSASVNKRPVGQGRSQSCEFAQFDAEAAARQHGGEAAFAEED